MNESETEYMKNAHAEAMAANQMLMALFHVLIARGVALGAITEAFDLARATHAVGTRKLDDDAAEVLRMAAEKIEHMRGQCVSSAAVSSIESNPIVAMARLQASALPYAFPESDTLQ